jgi:carbonic anhydrase
MRAVTRVLAVAVLVAACTAAPPASSSAPSTAPSPAHWTYEGEEGPANWGELSADYAACAEGTEQSPIDVANPSEADLANIAFDYRPAPLEIVNNGHTVQVNYAAGSSITVDGSAFALVQFHFHAPSEHTVAGAAADAELHLVHRADGGQLAVVGVLLTRGAANDGLAPVFENLPTTVGPSAAVPAATVDAGHLLPAVRTTYRYPGSLTTPPCTEGVSWLLMTDRVELSADQLAAFTSVIDGNNRPVQPLNEREVVEDTTR